MCLPAQTLFHRDISHKIKQNTTSASYPKMLRRIRRAAEAEAGDGHEDAPEAEAEAEADDNPPPASGEDDESEEDEDDEEESERSMSVDPPANPASPSADAETDEKHRSIMAELEQPLGD